MCLRFRTGFRAIALAAAFVAAPLVVPAGARDHDEARRAVEAGEIRPLAQILDLVRGKLPGEIVEVEIERENGLWVYEFKVVNGKGRLSEVEVDGHTGEIKRIKEK